MIFLACTVLFFMPTIGYIAAMATGITDPFHGLATAVAIVQGFALVPAVAFIWVKFRQDPAKYSLSLRSLRVVDFFLVGLLLLILIPEWWRRYAS